MTNKPQQETGSSDQGPSVLQVIPPGGGDSGTPASSTSGRGGGGGVGGASWNELITDSIAKRG